MDLEIEIDEARDDEFDFGAFGHEDPKHSDDDLEPHALQRSVIKGLNEEDLYPFSSFVKQGRISFDLCWIIFSLIFPSLDDSLNLKNLGLSDACLAYLASGGKAPTYFSTGLIEKFDLL